MKPNRTPDLIKVRHDVNGRKFSGVKEYGFSFDEGDRCGPISKSAFIVVASGELYISAFKLGRGQGHAKCLTQGNFLVIEVDTTDYTGTLWVEMGFTWADADISPEFPLSVYSLKTDNLRILSSDYVQERLKEYPELLAEYKAETTVLSLIPDEVFIRYLQRINDLMTW